MIGRSVGVGALLLGALFVGAVVLFQARLLQAVGDFLVASDAPVPSDAIIAISGDGEERVRTATDLFHQGYGRFLIVSGGPGGGSGSAAELARLAARFGVPPERVLLDAEARSTVGNAEGSAVVMRAHRLRTALLVTSPYHMRRAIVIFRSRFRPHGLAVLAAPVRDSFFQMEGWWTRRSSREFVIREYMELAAFLLGIY